MPAIDIPRVRSLLALHQISKTDFAKACGLRRTYVSTLLCERQQPGELALFKMQLGLQRLGLDREAARASYRPHHRPPLPARRGAPASRAPYPP